MGWSTSKGRNISPDDIPSLAAAVRAAAQCPPLLRDLADLYARLELQLGSDGVSCRACGQCCHFSRFGHRLYLSAAEAALLIEEPLPGPSGADEVCPYLHQGACTARSRRTLSCRAFFCDSKPDLIDLCERFHAELRQLHQKHYMPYAYAELKEFLSQLLEYKELR